MNLCEVCKQKPACASIALEDDGKLYLNVIVGSAVGNTIPLRYEVVPAPQEEISMPHQEGALCDACIRGYGGVGMLVPVLPACEACAGRREVFRVGFDDYPVPCPSCSRGEAR